MRNKTNIGAAILTLLLLLLTLHVEGATSNSNARQARDMFDNAWRLMSSPNGISLKYDVNIIGLYKCAGTLWVKGKKMHYIEDRYNGWYDGKYYWKVDKKKRVVERHNQNSPKKDKYTSKFKFNINDYNFSWKYEGNNIVLFMDANKSVRGVKHAKIYLNRKTHYPTALRVKVLFFWAKVNIYNFKPGGISNNIFTYPYHKYKSYRFKDCWPN